MAKSSRMGGDPNSRMSNVMSGVERSHRGEPSYRAHSTVRNESYLNNPVLGTSGPFKSKTLTSAPGKTSLQKTKNVPRTFLPTVRPPVKKPPAVVAKPVAKKAVVKPAAVISNVTREKLSPTKTAPARMAVNPRTGNTTGFTTGKTTGTSVSKSGVATKTYQSAGDRMKANAMNRTNQPAGPMGGGGGGRMGGGGASRTSSGGGNLGGARGRISEPGGSKR